MLLAAFLQRFMLDVNFFYMQLRHSDAVPSSANPAPVKDTWISLSRDSDDCHNLADVCPQALRSSTFRCWM